MSLARLALCLALLAPSLGFAQEVEEWAPYTPPATTPPPPLVPAEPPAPPQQPPAPEAVRPSSRQGGLLPGWEVSPPGSTALRLVASPFSGTMGGLIGGMGLAIAGSIFLLPFCTDALRELDAQPGCTVSFLALASLGVAGGATTGVYFTGRALGGRGHFLASLTGAVVGGTIGAVAGVTSQNTLVLLLGLGTGPIIGSLVGYELSHAMAAESAEPGPRPLLPFLSAAPGGGLVGGLRGRF
jgi:hypothetical protein